MLEARTLPATAVQRFYRYQACIYDLTRWTILHGRRKAIARLGLQPDSTVLEVGCGTGLNFKYILHRLDPQRGRLIGLDFSPHMLRHAARRIAARGYTHVNLIEADATRMDLPERFDGILFAYSLTMIPDWQAVLARARDHLKPGGRLVVLDFGTFAAWGPLGALPRGWLRLNHVDTRRPYLDDLRERLANLRVEQWLGGYNFIAVGDKPACAG